jgi:penicillin G amidase
LPPGQSGFIELDGHPGPHFGDQVSLFNQFGYKPISLDFPNAGGAG